MQATLEALSHFGRFLVITSWIVLFFDVAAMVTYTIRSGSKDTDEETTENSNESSLGEAEDRGTARQQLVTGKYCRQTNVLLQASGFVTDDALVDGSATLG